MKGQGHVELVRKATGFYVDAYYVHLVRKEGGVHAR
jgi:hypothetical protein